MAMILRTWRILRAVWPTAGEKQLGLRAAGGAVFGLFGIFPGIAAVIAIFGLVADPIVIAEQLSLMEGFIPPDAYGLIALQINRSCSATVRRGSQPRNTWRMQSRHSSRITKGGFRASRPARSTPDITQRSSLAINSESKSASRSKHGSPVQRE